MERLSIRALTLGGDGGGGNAFESGNNEFGSTTHFFNDPVEEEEEEEEADSFSEDSAEDESVGGVFGRVSGISLTGVLVGGGLGLTMDD